MAALGGHAPHRARHLADRLLVGRPRIDLQPNDDRPRHVSRARRIHRRTASATGGERRAANGMSLPLRPSRARASALNPESGGSRKVRVLHVSADFLWPAGDGGRIRYVAQLRVIASLPEVERIDLFCLCEEEIRAERRGGRTPGLPKLRILEPGLHPLHLFRPPPYVPHVVLPPGV